MTEENDQTNPLKTHVDGCILEIITNGCKISTKMLEIYFSTAVSLAKIEAIKETNEHIFKINQTKGL